MPGFLRVPFFQDELLISYLSRTARANGSASMRAFCSHVGVDFDAFALGRSEAVGKFAAVLGEQADGWLARRIEAVSGSSFRYRGELFVDGMMHAVPRHFCRHCLAQDMLDNSGHPATRQYARTEWTLQCVQVCPRHSRPLLTLPKVPWMHRTDICAIFDGIADRDNGTEVHLEPSDFERYVSRRVRGERSPTLLLDNMSLPAAILASEAIGRAALFGRVFRDYGLGGSAMRETAACGYLILESGPDAVKNLLDSLCRSVETMHGTNGAAVYGGLYHALDAHSDQYPHLTAIVANHAYDRFPRLPAGAMFPDAAGRHRKGQPLWPTSTAERSRIAIPAPTSMLRSNDAPEPTSLQIARRSVDFQEAARMLGCSIVDLVSMIAVGIIDRSDAVDRGDGEKGDRVLLRQIAGIRDKIENSSTSAAGLVSLETAIADLGCTAGQALRPVLQGRLRNVSDDRSKPFFQGMSVDSFELGFLVGVVGTATTCSVRKRLRISQSALLDLVRRGLIRASKSYSKGTLTFSRKDVAEFERDYVTLGSLAARHRISKRTMKKRLSAAGVVPVLSFPIMRTNVYYRIDLDPVTFSGENVTKELTIIDRIWKSSSDLSINALSLVSRWIVDALAFDHRLNRGASR